MWILKICVPLVLLVALVAADGGHRHSHRSGRRGRQRSRGGRQDSSVADAEPVQGGVDFSDCETQDDGMCCVMREEEITTLKKDPILECTHKSVEKCHYTYVTEFSPVQEEVCEENFEKKCQITFKQMAVTETVKKCYRPLMKTCGNEANPSRLRVKRQLAEYGDANDSGSLADANNEQCKTFYETACTTKYVEKQPGKFVGDTSCEKLPIELCGEGCRVEEGEEECHDKEIDTLIDVPEEVCDLNPQKTCKFQTKLVPKLKPTHECTVIPQEICQLKFTTPREEPVPFMSKWCIDPNAEVTPDTTYDENDAAADPIGPEVTESSRPDALYGAPGGGDQPEYQDYEEEDLSIPPPPPVEDEPFEQTESTYEEPVYDDFDDSAASALDTGYGSPAPSAPRGGPRRNGGNAGPRRGNRPKGNRRKNGQNGGRRRQRPQGGAQRGAQASPNTLYGAPAPAASSPLASYGSALPSYGFEDELPSYGKRARRRSASEWTPVYIPGAHQAHYYYNNHH